MVKSRENAGIKHLNDPMHLLRFQIQWIMFMKILMITIQGEKELFIRSRKFNISFVFISQSYFSVPKDARLNTTHYLIMTINNKKDLQNVAVDHSAETDYKDFIRIYRECMKEPYSFLTIVLGYQ